jgi:hypothetical protein
MESIMLKLSSLVLIAMFSFNTLADERMCHYSVYKWNTVQRKAVDFKLISKPYRKLTPAETDPYTGCSVCREDQMSLSIEGLPEFTVCKNIARQIEHALIQARQSGQKIVDITGYRVGKTRGAIDAAGNRTGFSNHSFGTAVDFNQGFNGLYDHCIEFNPSCRLIKGGHWKQDQPLSIQANSPLVGEMQNIGFKWGGMIRGKQKDFMHFSPTGY